MSALRVRCTGGRSPGIEHDTEGGMRTGSGNRTRNGTVTVRKRTDNAREAGRAKPSVSRRAASETVRMRGRDITRRRTHPHDAHRRVHFGTSRRRRQKPEGIGGRWRRAGWGKLVYLKRETNSENRESPHINLMRLATVLPAVDGFSEDESVNHFAGVEADLGGLD